MMSEKVFLIAIVLTIGLLHTNNGTVAQTSKPLRKQTSVETPSQHEAQVHYKTASVALQNNDFVIAEKELKAAVNLVSNNATYLLGLAEVQSKRDEVSDASATLKRTKECDIPSALKERVDTLEAELAYQTQKLQRDEALKSYIGAWRVQFHKSITTSWSYDYVGTLYIESFDPSKQTLSGSYVADEQSVDSEAPCAKRSRCVHREIHTCKADYQVGLIMFKDMNPESLYLTSQSQNLTGNEAGTEDISSENGCKTNKLNDQTTYGGGQLKVALTRKSPTSIEAVGINYWGHYGATLTKIP